MDAFYAAVEQLEHHELRNKPILIGHPGLRGVVATASYEARVHGVGSAMPMALAKKKCPEAIVVRPRIERYAKYSKKIMQVFRDFSPVVEPLSLDEAFIDLSGTEHLWGSVEEIGEQLKEAVFKATGGLRVSVGISSTKYVAKVASDHNKPDGLTIVSPEDAKSFLAVLPVSRIWGIGKNLNNFFRKFFRNFFFCNAKYLGVKILFFVKISLETILFIALYELMTPE